MSAEVHDVAAEMSVETWEQPCESHWHERHGDGSAVWIVWQIQCCDKRPAFGMVCDPCVQAFLTYPGGARCRDCGHLSKPARRAVIRIEPLGGAA